MSKLQDINKKLVETPYVSGYTASTEDAKLYNDIFGKNDAVASWAARMACYYEAERNEIAGKTAHADPKKN